MNLLNTAEFRTITWLMLCYVNCTSIIRKNTQTCCDCYQTNDHLFGSNHVWVFSLMLEVKEGLSEGVAFQLRWE